MDETKASADNLDDLQVPAIDIEIVEHTPHWERLDDLENGIALAVQMTFQVVDFEISRSCQITIVLSDNEEVQRLNNFFRGFDKPTNVLSFPFGQQDPVPPEDVMPLGDIILAYETLKNEANELNIKLDHHVYHLIIHGLLHLLGYDHETEDDAHIMETLEKEIMLRLDLPNPYRH